MNFANITVSFCQIPSDFDNSEGCGAAAKCQDHPQQDSAADDGRTGGSRAASSEGSWPCTATATEGG